MKFSIIVPVYNVADYLEKCVDSLLAQDCADAEIILVDDGSTDGKCPALCDRLASEHPRQIRVIHQENGGLGAARNSGIEAARGDYLLFVDSDDWLAPNTLEALSQAVDRWHADMYCFSFRYVTEDGSETPAEPRTAPVDGIPTTLTRTPELLLDPPMACTRLCKRSLFVDHNIRFPGRVWYEDLCTTPKLLLEAASVVQLEGDYYRYLQREGSIMRSSKLRRNLEILNAAETFRDYYTAHGAMEQYRDWLSFLSLQNLMDAARRVLMEDPKAEYLPKFLDYMREKYPDYRKNPLLSRLGRKKQILLRLLEGKQYSLARTMFRLANQLKS